MYVSLTTCIIISAFIIVAFDCTSCEFTIPPVTFEVYKPRGFSASITDISGVKLFAFHGRRNQPLNLGEPGEYNDDIIKPTAGKWIYTNPEAELKVGDIINYWIFIQNNQSRYRKDNLVYEVRELLPEPSPTCNHVISVINERISERVCTNEIIFEDDFSDGIDFKKWKADHFIPTNSKDYEFVSYRNDSKVLYAHSSKLYIKLQPHRMEDNIRGILDLRKGCSGSGNECLKQQHFYQILPPVISARINSRFTFRYGKVEVKAKVPSGDWIYPQIHLKSNNGDVEVVIAYVRGNYNLTGPNGDDIGSCILYGGVKYQFQGKPKERLISWNSSTPLSADMHVYAVIWRKDEIKFLVDGYLFGSLAIEDEVGLQADGLTEKQFHITLGVGVGGINDFPDGYISGQNNAKPWQNKDVKQARKFFDARNNWLPTWDNGNPALEVDYIKVYA